MNYYCLGRCYNLPNGLKLMTVEVNGRTVHQLLSTTGSCHQAAFCAQMYAIRMVRRSGIRNATIWNTSRHVVEQINGTWEARSKTMRRARNACRAAGAGLGLKHRVL